MFSILNHFLIWWSKDTFVTRLIYKIFVIIFFPLTLIIFFLVILLRPILLIRFSLLPDMRIGHFALDLAIYYKTKEKMKNKKLILDIFCFTHKHHLANGFLKKKWKEKLIIKPRFIVAPLIRLTNFFFKFFSVENIHIIPLTSFDKDNLIWNSKKILKFSKEEFSKGKEILSKMGITDMRKMIVLTARDSAYLNKTQPDKDWTYHNYRDIELEKFVDLVKFLVKKNYFVLRMGKIVSRPFPFKHKKFIDYPYSKFKSDFLDIFICANSYFTISSLTGLDSISYIFKRPILGIQFPFQGVNILNHCTMITLPKFFSKSKSLFLKSSELSQIIQSEKLKNEADLMSPKILKKYNLIMKGNTKNEIKYAGIDMLKKLKNSKIKSIDQKNFWKQIIDLNYNFKNLSSKKITTVKTSVAFSYYKKNRKYLDF